MNSQAIIQAKTEISVSGCWVWTAAIDKDGYGRFGSKLAHRESYCAFKGPIPSGLEIDHKCRNRACVNPSHLETVTHRENMSRAVYANTQKTHCKHGHELSGDNLYMCKRRRCCRKCNAIRTSKYQRKIK